MNDVGNLLQMIYDLLTGWYNSFTSHAVAVMEKLNLIEEDTASIKISASDIKSNTDDIKDNTGAIITPVQSIKTNTDSIKTDTTSIKNNVSTMTNQLGTISTNVGTASSFTEDVANNTLNIKDKIVTIASDTTQIRSNTNTVVTDMSKVYEALKWALIDKVTTETVEGTDSISFDTDLSNDLIELTTDISATQSGSGVPSPTNVRSIIGNTDKSIIVNGNNVTIALGQTVFGGNLDVVSGVLKITHTVLSKNISDMNNTEAYPGWRNSGIRAIIGAGIDGNLTTLVNIGYTYSFNTKSTNDIIYLSKGDYNMTQAQWIANYPNLTVEMLVPYSTPIEIQLTPSQIATIKGINTISSDGNIKCTYEESIKHYLDKQEA